MLPSRTLRKFAHEAIGDRDYISGVQANLAVANAVKDGMNSPFGAAVIASLDNLESSAYATLAKTHPWRSGRIAQAQAELRTAQYIKAILGSYVANADVLQEQIEELYGARANG